MFYEVLGDEPVSAQKKAAVTEILEANEKGENYIITSVITHLEVLPTKLEGKGVDDEADYLAQFDAQKMGDIEINSNILLRAREIRDFYYKPAGADGKGAKMMDLGDSIHLATASIYGAVVFHTRDDDHKGTKISLLKLYEGGTPKLCGKYDLKIESPESPQGNLDLPKPEQKQRVDADQATQASKEAVIAVAKVAEADEDEERWEEGLKTVPKPPAKSVKKQK